MRTLIVTSNPALTQVVELMLSRENEIVEVAEPSDAVSLATHYDFDLIVVDGRTPVVEVSQLRKAGIKTTCMAVVDPGTDQAFDKVATVTSILNAGADDVVVRPFHNDELMARVRAVVRRSKGEASAILSIGGLAIDMDAQSVEVNGQRVPTTGKEYAILELLALRKGSTVTKETILNHLYGGRDEPHAKIVDVFVCKLRKKLAAAGNGGFEIETMWGRGYLVRETEAVARAA